MDSFNFQTRDAKGHRIYEGSKLETKTRQWRHTKRPKENRYEESLDQNERKIVNAGRKILFEEKNKR